jgi:hypothetical protein
MSEPKRPTTMYNKALSEAIQEIYRVYGPNLSAFFRDVEDEAGYANCGRELQSQLTEGNPRKRSRLHATR